MAYDGEVRIKASIDTSGISEDLNKIKNAVDQTANRIENASDKAEQAFENVADKAEEASDAIEDGGKKGKNAGDKIKDGADKASKSIKQTKTEANTLGSTLKDISSISLGALGTVGAAVGIATKTIEAIGECVEAYKVQEKAELALQTAAKNNPYLNGESVRKLKAYASELQSVSNVGDETILPLMAQLAAAGRTEEEISKIMKASLDVSASGAMSLESAVKNLNKTYSGLSGELGEAIPQIKNLTAEQLKNGEAIDVIAQQYKGMAEAVQDVSIQLSNAWGDLKENIGGFFDKATQSFKEEVLRAINEFNNTAQKLEDTKLAKQAVANVNAGNATKDDYEVLFNTYEKRLNDLAKQIEQKQEAIERLQKSANNTDSRIANPAKVALSQAEAELEKIRQERLEFALARDAVLQPLNEIYANEKKIADEAERTNKALAEEKRLEDERNARNQQATDHINAINNSVNAQKQRLELLAKLSGDTIKAEELYQLYMNAYADLITNSNGLITENNSAAKTLLIDVEKYKQLAEEEARIAEEKRKAEEDNAKTTKEKEQAQAEAEKNANALLKKVPQTEAGGFVNEYLKQVQDLATLKQEIIDNELIAEEAKSEAIIKIEEALLQKRKDLYANLTSEVASYVDEIVNITSQASDLMLKNSQMQYEIELAQLDERYEKGELTEEEYYNKQKELKRKAAQEEYKIKLFEWNTSMLSAMANIAEGVSKAIAQGAVGGIITGALVAAAGAVQIAAIQASKPIPPSFATGGVIGGMNGATMGSDNTLVHARNGEMIMNANQQRTLWELINGQPTSKNPGLNITVNNTQSDNVRTQIRQENNTLYLDILDKHINKGFSDGTYDAGLAGMNTRQEGVILL